jgi:hypothetical protein
LLKFANLLHRADKDAIIGAMTLDTRSPGQGRLLAAAAGALALALAAPASGATWANGRTTPSFRQIVAIDATGEPGWPYGREDVAGDGLAAFTQAEQALDVRTAYAATDAARLWLRAYVSDVNAINRDVVVFVFIDSDALAVTGGPATAPEIEARLTSDPSPGGYEYVLGMRGDGTVEGLWSWQEATKEYARENGRPGQGETGRDLDPIRIGPDARGYVQANIELATVGVALTCGSNFFFRSVNAAQGATGGDLDVGALAACVAADANNDGVPDTSVPPSCTADAECPNRGVCVDQRCVLAVPCGVDADCPAGRECSDDGRCVVPDGGACSNNSQCGGRVCQGGTCVACTPGGAQCGPGQRCNPDGACVGANDPGGVAGGTGGPGGGGSAGVPGLDPDGQVEGGAFNCSGAGGAGAGGGAAAVAALLFAAARGRRRAQGHRER